MQKRIFVLGAILFLTSIGVSIAKQLPPLPTAILPQTSVLNVMVQHIAELERKVAGMQKQITILHAMVRAK